MYTTKDIVIIVVGILIGLYFIMHKPEKVESDKDAPHWNAPSRFFR